LDEPTLLSRLVPLDVEQDAELLEHSAGVGESGENISGCGRALFQMAV
jgi:hypothetical protein